MTTNYARIGISAHFFILKALTDRVIVHHSTVSSNPTWVKIRKNSNSDLKYELIFLAILLLVLTIEVTI